MTDGCELGGSYSRFTKDSKVSVLVLDETR